MNRRDALRYTTYLTGLAISAPTLTALLSGCGAGAKEPSAPPYDPTFLSAEEYDFVGQLAETILPRTDTPGALEVGVPEFIDRLVGQGYEPEDRDRFLAGLRDFMKKTNSTLGEGQTFGGLSAEQQVTYLNGVDQAMRRQVENWKANPAKDEAEAESRYNFFQNFKELTLVGYFSSQPVGTELLAYDPVPGAYEPCIPLSQVGKTWAL